MITISFNTKQLEDKIKSLKDFPQRLDKVLSQGAVNIEAKAKQKAPVDEGRLRGSISSDISKPLEKKVSANIGYAAFREFGTGAFAAAYVSSLPDTWQAYASEFKGQKGGTFKEMVRNIAEWIRHKGLAANTALHGTYSVKTKKRTGNKKANADADLQLAYVIARSILIKGIKPHPFLYPAYFEEKDNIINAIKDIFK